MARADIKWRDHLIRLGLARWKVAAKKATTKPAKPKQGEEKPAKPEQGATTSEREEDAEKD